MSERLSDEDLANFIHWNEVYDKENVSASTLIAKELRERRAADLTAEDREALAEVLREVQPSDVGMPGLVSERACAVLSRLVEARKP